MKLKPSPFYLLFCFTLFSCSSLPAQENAKPTATPGSVIEIREAGGTYLYGTKATRLAGALTKQGGDYYIWKGNSEMSWMINVPSGLKYDIYLIAAVPKTTNGKAAIFSANSKNETFTLTPTSGPWGNGGKNFQRLKVMSDFSLAKGNQEVTLKTINSTSDNSELYFRSLELVPVSATATIEAQEKRAIASRASTGWLAKAGYGVMFHWTSQSVNPDGSHKTYEEAVNAFDVTKFAQMVEETGAGYVIFTIGHAEQYCPAPISSWEKLHPGKTTQRDLISEIARELNAKGIRLILYMHSLGTANFKQVDNEQFFQNFRSILEEFGLRYKALLAGYWFDCWYQIFEGYPDISFENFYNCTKAGYNDRIMCLNSWIYPSVTPWQDYWAGEAYSLIDIPENGFMKDGPVPDLPYQALITMEPYWVQEKANKPDPRYNTAQYINFIQGCMNNGGAVTINIGIYQDGTIGEKALQVMRDIKTQIRNK